MKKWSLPDPIPKVVAWHHQPSRALAAGGEVAQYVCLVRLAERIDRTLRLDALPSAQETERIAATTECEYLGFRARDLEKLWDELRAVKQEAQQIFR